MDKPAMTFFEPEKPAVFFTLFDNEINVAHINENSSYDGVKNATPSISVFKKAENYLSTWPEISEEITKYVKYINPIACSNYPDNIFYSSSGTSQDELGVIHTTFRHPFTLAEAMVHEMAHIKLFVLGIDYEHSEGIIINQSSDKFYSPIKECERPMSAIFHAQYSFIHVLYLNNLILKLEEGHNDFPQFLALTKDTYLKMKEGHSIIEKHMEVDNKGKKFIDQFMLWSDQTINSTKIKLNGYGIS